MATHLQTMEVATARVYNWDIVRKRKEKEEEIHRGKGQEAGQSEGVAGPPND
jgi:hypothetical protein